MSYHVREDRKKKPMRIVNFQFTYFREQEITSLFHKDSLILVVLNPENIF